MLLVLNRWSLRGPVGWGVSLALAVTFLSLPLSAHATGGMPAANVSGWLAAADPRTELPPPPPPPPHPTVHTTDPHAAPDPGHRSTPLPRHNALRPEAFEPVRVNRPAAHNLRTQETWKGERIGDVVRGALSPFIEGADRIDVTGPAVWIPPRIVLALSMAVHELGTNATKYGALSKETGKVEIAWSSVDGANDEALQIRWREKGGPTVAPPARRGFGSRLIQQGLASDLGGKVELLFEPNGVICEIELPLQKQGGEELHGTIAAA